MQSAITTSKIQYWENQAESDIKAWRGKVYKIPLEIYNVPDQLLDKDPSLIEYKTNFIRKYAFGSVFDLPNLSHDYINYRFDELFIYCACHEKWINTSLQINKLSKKYDLGAIFEYIDNDLFRKEILLPYIKLAKNSLHLEPLLKDFRVYPWICEDLNTISQCVQLCPEHINRIPKYAYKIQEITVKEMDTDKQLNIWFQIAYNSNPIISKWNLFYTSPLFIFQRQLEYNFWIYKKILHINAAAYVHIDWDILLKDAYKEHFIELHDSINNLFFEFTNENSKNLIREARSFKPELVIHFFKLYFQKQLYELSVASNIFFHYI